MRPYSSPFHPCYRRVKDYDRDKMYRLQDFEFEAELTRETLVSVMLRLGKRRHASALNVLGRVWSIEVNEAGGYLVHFELHDLRNKPNCELRETFSNGLIQGPIDDALLTEQLEASVTEVYLQPYRLDHQESELQGIINQSRTNN